MIEKIIEDNAIKNLSKDIPLEIRFKVLLELFYINLITDLGFREEKMWNENDEEDMKLLNKILETAKKDSESFVEEVERWQKDNQKK